MKVRFTIISLMMFLAAMTVRAQEPEPETPAAQPEPTFLINIGGSVYGGGNAGDMSGSTKVTVYAGDLKNVYGGARQADVGGATFVHIDGENASDDIFIVNVYGGNDISGTIGQGSVETTVPAELENIKKTAGDAENKEKNNIDNTWKTFVRTSALKEEDKITVGEVKIDSKMLVVASLFGGGNGDYIYKEADGTTDLMANGKYIVRDGDGNIVATSSSPFNKPDLSKTYLEIKGGCIAHVYGGGNNATVTGATTINIDNSSDHLENSSKVFAAKYGMRSEEQVTNYFQSKVKLSTFQSNLTSWAFNHARVFGGNNKAKMSIMPKWNMQKGIIRDLYSGGNEGDMICKDGLLLEIDPIAANQDKLVINNVYGGCRRADVRPQDKIASGEHAGEYQDVTVYTPEGYNFPAELSARTLVRGGQITNVYGGNDISGKVYGGNAVGIYTSVLGNVYGGGNGSYAYTDNTNLATLDNYKDFYYDPGDSSVDALNAFRPNAEQVSIRLAGTDPNNPIIIKGSVFVGGNSATLKKKQGVDKPMVELKIGSYVIADKVFLGNNGENMIKYTDTSDALKIYRQYVDANGALSDDEREGWKFNSMNLKEDATFAKYMNGCAMDLMPRVVFDSRVKEDPSDYIEYSSSIGSFYCGGNVGSMTVEGTTTIDFSDQIIIYDKLVGGCNSAIVPETAYNAAFNGGLIGAESERGTNYYTDDGLSTGNIKDRLVLNLDGLKIQPKRWATNGTKLEWNTVDGDGAPTPPVEVEEGQSGFAFNQATDLTRRFVGGNIYGGCYTSGIVNGNVVINLDGTIVDRGKKDSELAVGEEDYGVFDGVDEDDVGEAVYYNYNGNYTINKRRSGVILAEQGMDAFGDALNLYGGGKGRDTEIWGSTTINLNAGYAFQVFGGSQEGVIGRPVGTSDKVDFDYTGGAYSFNGKAFTYDPRYSCYVNLKGAFAGVSKQSEQNDAMAECEFMYGGGFEGPVCGNTVINLGQGRIFNSYGGSCNADILGHAETFIGRQVKNEYKLEFGKFVHNENTYEGGFPWIRDNVYGANDFGGRILSEESFKNRVRKDDDQYGLDVLGMVHNPATPGTTTIPETPNVVKASAYVEYLQGRADAIFGGNYGTYDYKERKYSDYTDNNGEPLVDASGNPKFFKPRINNAFVNFRPTYYNARNVVKRVFGAGRGQSRETDRDLMQNRSYVLIDIPQISETESVNFNKYTAMEVFGAGAWGGVGMGVPAKKKSTPDGTSVEEDPDNASAIIDLIRGDIGAAYGASFDEGVTRRTVVNVPAAPAGSPAGTKGSTIKIGCIFGGGYGSSRYLPCDAYETNVEYHSADACLIFNENDDNPYKDIQKGAIYGGNNSKRRTLYAKVNIDVPLRLSHIEYGMTTGYIFGSGCGTDTWSEYTEVNLQRGAEVYEVYGGGQDSKVLNTETIQKYMNVYKPSKWEDNTTDFSDADWLAAWKLGGDCDPDNFTPGTANDVSYINNTKTNLANDLVRVAEIDDRADIVSSDTKHYRRYNTNVIINEGATVNNYVYGGGYGPDAYVAGSTYVALLGGEVKKDIYGSGTSGSVEDFHKAEDFIASTNIFIKGGTARNVYGGGWRGNIGSHEGLISQYTNNADDALGESHVVVGDIDGTSFLNGIPAIIRNVYGGGEGGSVFGTAYVTINKGYIGYRYNTVTNKYVEEINETGEDHQLEGAGNVFGGGYIANSYVDHTDIKMYGGMVRGSLFGGGEIGAIGRGTVKSDAPIGLIANDVAKIYKGGETHVFLYGGHVIRNVFGGGRGYDNWGGDGTKFMKKEEVAAADLSSKGYVFGTTDVHIRGGEVGTAENALHGFGNIFGGGDEGFIYCSAGNKLGTRVSDDELVNGLPTGGGGYYYKGGVIANGLSICSNVAVEPYCLVRAGQSIELDDYVRDANGNIVFETEGDASGNPKKNGSKITFAAGEYVPMEYLNQLMNKTADAARWGKLYTDGVTIHNAVFAGGNITEGSDVVFANTVTVYGNAAAAIRDIYNRDLISIGTDDIGGIYGDGNLTLVDGFRELHIDNYGTDFYNLSDKVMYSVYESMTDREKAYYQLRYVALSTHTYTYYVSLSLHTDDDTGVAYKKGQKVTEATYKTFSETEKENWNPGTKNYVVDDQIEDSEYALMDPVEQQNWRQDGVFSKYAGRPLNTIQRADMCGVYGSRLVLKGAQDRASEKVDYKDYTINRVDEVSLNQRRSQAGNTGDDALHGNYFGIYSSVKFLGNLTSDVHFKTDEDVRRTDDSDGGMTADGRTYYAWKLAQPNGKDRNNGISYNKVALASGVYLEIKREEGEVLDMDKWGHVTGVIELDLINVMPGMGGGYVYAKNEHGVKTSHADYGKLTLLDYNLDAVTYRRFTYDESNKEAIETSGNFVHNTKQIVDDCYPNSGRYTDAGYVESPAHYWFIRGSIYVYDQYISAYTGAANAYAEKVELPLTISAAANGRMTLREVQPNYYAYYDKNGNKLGDYEETFVVNEKAYSLNDPISYWDYRLLSDADKEKFVEETYTTIAECTITIGETTYTYPKGYTLLPGKTTNPEPGTYNYLRQNAPMKKLNESDTEQVRWVHHVDQDKDVDFDFVFRPSNNLSHETGYILTYDVNNPMVWNDYYTKSEDRRDKINTKEYDDEQTAAGQTIVRNDYTASPTYTPKSSGLYGQREYSMGEIINKAVYDKYQSVASYLSDPTGQALMEAARIVTGEISVEDENGKEVQRLFSGVPISRNAKYVDAEGNLTSYTDAQWADITAKSEAAKVCTKLLQFSSSDYVYVGKLLSSADIAELKTKVMAAKSLSEADAIEYLKDYVSDAYYCYEGGLYGGSYFEEGKAYRALDTWCDLSKEERANFTFNYDAFDVLIDPTYSGRLEENYGIPKVQYDGYKINTTAPLYDGDTPLNPKIYSETQAVDYQAEFRGYNEVGTDDLITSITYTDEDGHSHTITANSDPHHWLTREQYEDIPNERHHYSPITVREPRDYYVVKSVFMRGDVPYTVGQVIEPSTYESLNDDQKANIDVYTFTSDQTISTIEDEKVVYTPVNYYYCRDNYTVNEKGMGKSVTTVNIKKNGTDVSEETYYVMPEGGSSYTNTDIPQGAIIDQANYNALNNFQKGFLIHGMSPTEVSTLYVSSESDIYDLSKEKIITVIYLYEYEESDESGLNVTPVSERHIVNIHIQFESGVPEVGELKKPDIVLPGTSLVLEVPSVTEGAYRVTGSGWELFYKETDADTHTNGVPYVNNVTPLYWYQNNYWIAYYAQTYLGKTYSNAVQVNVANYHDLKDVMTDKTHHYYIDHRDVDYEPKIYINNYSSTGGNGLDLLKDLIDLSHVELTYNTDLEGNSVPEPISGGRLDGHIPLERTSPTETYKPMRGGKYLEFIMRADQDHSGSAWTPIANGDGECFSGALHGDGYTISGLSNSLFNHLCGDVYNLGVTGTFSGAGVAETGEGYMENCWINTTGTPDGSVRAVFGAPSASDGTIQIVNSYYPSHLSYNTTDTGSHGLATAKPASAFYNGEVAYDLNGFYLWKRYNDQNTSSGTSYQYYTVGSDNSLELQEAKYYESDPTLCSSGYIPGSASSDYVAQKYVEDRFANGDFIYAGGSIPSGNERVYTYQEGTMMKTTYFPIWPDDYIFFGQALNYDHMDGLDGRDLRTHQENPSVIRKSNDRILTSVEGNRVYRAPAYFRSKEMGVAHFNPYAVFAQSKKNDVRYLAYKDMTAIDFTGYNDADKAYQKGWSQWSKTSQTADGTSTDAYAFYPPLLDDGGVEDFYNADLTRNLLAYTMTSTVAATKTNGTVGSYLHDEPYEETPTAPANSNYSDIYRYHTVDRWDSHSDNVRGHWVQRQGDLFVAQNDHMLVDRQDYNAPIGYSFAEDMRMWYQRMPDNYVGQKNAAGTAFIESNAGWEGVSLPFKVDIVTTDTKGEITHFYGGSWESKNDTHTKIGHEYWLRRFVDGGSVKTENNQQVYEANFEKPAANSADGTKEYTNTFLWDYYYSYNNYYDQNGDEYQEYDDNHDYYRYAREHTSYPRIAAAMPYIIGFPGERYYEFDLSGKFVAQTAARTYPAILDAQTITFASAASTDDAPVTIGVSDDEIEEMAATTTYDNYTFRSNYLNNPKMAQGKHGFLLNSDGNSFVESDAETPAAVAFRPYFVATASTQNISPTRSIVFGNEPIEEKGGEEHGDPRKGDGTGSLNIYAKNGKIFVESSLNFTEDVRIVTPAGITVSTFAVKPGQTVEVRADASGMYIVHTLDGQYTKKVAVNRAYMLSM